MVNNNQGILRAYDQKEEIQKDPENLYHLLVITGNLGLSQSLGATLEHFFLNKRRINVVQVMSFQEAIEVMKQKPETILVVVDDHVHLNGAYAAFIEHVRGKLQNRQCVITLKGDLVHSKNPVVNSNDKGFSPEFIDARERLIEIVRMILLTNEMEQKISHVPVERILQDVENEFNRGAFDYQADSSWDRLYATMAQDLKQPVGNIKVVLDFLTNEPDLLDRETSKDLLMRVREAADNVHELLEDFLFWNRMVRRNIQFHPVKVDLIFAIRENLFIVKNLAAVKEISFAFDMPGSAFVFADEYMLNTILRNLLYNAIKFTNRDCKIEISVVKEKSSFKVVIKDNGAGMLPINLEEFFSGQRAMSVVGAARETGTGLGLAICKDFIEKNGGEMYAESFPAIGNAFSFTLPAC
jgi:nitrogen-specific signal transduction histidine kinase